MSTKPLTPTKKEAAKAILTHLEQEWSKIRWALRENKVQLKRLNSDRAVLKEKRRMLRDLSLSMTRSLDAGVSPIPCRQCGRIGRHTDTCPVYRPKAGQVLWVLSGFHGKHIPTDAKLDAAMSTVVKTVCGLEGYVSHMVSPVDNTVCPDCVKVAKEASRRG